MDGKKYDISVCIIASPNENIDKCIWSIERQTYPFKEIIVHRGRGMYSKLRNKVIDKAGGEIIAFIDADCYAEKHWLEEVNRIFQDKSIIGVWGKVCYELYGAEVTISTRIVSNDGQGVSNSNASFRAEILKKIRYDEEISSKEDWVLDKRMKKAGKVIYSNDVIVFHQHRTWSFRRIINQARRFEDMLKIHLKYKIPIRKIYFIAWPEHYIIIFLPFMVFFVNSVRNFNDFKVAIGNYIGKVYTRLLIWKFAIKNRIFLI